MSGSIVGALVIAVIVALAGAAYALYAGWGWLAAIAVYSFGGAVTVVAVVALGELVAAMRAGREQVYRGSARLGRPQERPR